MDKQKVFDTVLGAMRKQGQKSVDHNGKCKYRGIGGLKCAIGHLFPDEMYTPDMEYKGIHGLLRRAPNVLKAIGVNFDSDGKSQLFFLQELQDGHDCYMPDFVLYHDMTRYERRMAYIAERYSLKYVKPSN